MPEPATVASAAAASIISAAAVAFAGATTSAVASRGCCFRPQRFRRCCHCRGGAPYYPSDTCGKGVSRLAIHQSHGHAKRWPGAWGPGARGGGRRRRQGVTRPKEGGPEAGQGQAAAAQLAVRRRRVSSPASALPDPSTASAWRSRVAVAGWCVPVQGKKVKARTRTPALSCRL